MIVLTLNQGTHHQGKNVSFWTVREFQHFLLRVGKVREFWSGLGQTNFVIYFWTYFWKQYVLNMQIFPHFARIFMWYLSDSCHEVRESQGKWPRKVREFKSSRLLGNLLSTLDYIFEHTCAYARWAHMHRCLSVTGPKVTRPKIIGQGKRSRGSRSGVKWVKPSLKVTLLAGGLMSTSSCIFCHFKEIWC